MTPTVEDLAYAVYRLGSEEELAEGFRQDVLDKLVEFNMVRVEVDSAPTLTQYGRKTYNRIIGGRGDDIPEFNVDLP
jgi:hypothetical protein